MDNSLLRQKEFVRKTFHIVVSVIILFDILSHNLAVLLTVLAISFYTIFEVMRLSNIEITYYRRLVDICSRSNTMTGFVFDPLLLAIPILLTILFFKPTISYPTISYPTILIITISDGLSTLTGINFGRTKILGNKTLEGSIMFFLTAILILSFFNNIFNTVFIAFFITNVELVSKNYDNLTLPLFSVFIMSLI